MKEPTPHDVLPWTGCIPWARASPPGRENLDPLENPALKSPAQLGEDPKEILRDHFKDWIFGGQKGYI
jgi:hypothetical protein